MARKSSHSPAASPDFAMKTKTIALRTISECFPLSLDNLD
jgi:hypothetical protein